MRNQLYFHVRYVILPLSGASLEKLHKPLIFLIFTKNKKFPKLIHFWNLLFFEIWSPRTLADPRRPCFSCFLIGPRTLADYEFCNFSKTRFSCFFFLITFMYCKKRKYMISQFLKIHPGHRKMTDPIFTQLVFHFILVFHEKSWSLIMYSQWNIRILEEQFWLFFEKSWLS